MTKPTPKMQKNLVIVESPAKAKTIEKFLGKEYKVKSSYGHIRDLKKKQFSIDTEHFTPQYEIPTEKAKIVKELKAEAKEAETIWLASDEDREGEAISWHLAEVLGLKPENTKRIVFHEITKTAILNAIENPRTINLNLVNAQQARRVLDRIVGFKLSPILWRKVKPALSAGRVQSVAVRLIVEREREIQQFKSEESYHITAIFTPTNTPDHPIKAILNNKFKTKDQAKTFLQQCKNAIYTIGEVTKRPQKRIPAPPFTTATLQQEAAHKLGFTVAQTMLVAQRLYESGRITYMRTDSVNLSTLCIGAAKKVIQENWGTEYVKSRQFQTKTKGAQEAHEAIRPTDMKLSTIAAPQQETKLYELIWKRTIASQMSEAEIEKTTATINISNTQNTFTATGEVIKFDGFLKIYRESTTENNETDELHTLPPLKQGETLQNIEIEAAQKFTQHPGRYNEASLVRKLEELGIGRPSTYAPTISTIQQREYVTKGNKEGTTTKQNILKLTDNTITEKNNTITVGTEKNKLLPTDIGIVVNDFLMEYFPEIMDYNFTAEVEKKFDEIADGKTEWHNMVRQFYENLQPEVEKTLHTQTEHKVGERLLGQEPTTGKPVFAKIGRYGPIVQIGNAENSEKPRFAQIKKTQKLETITLDEALDLFKLPRIVGEFEGKEVTIGTGRFGPYILHQDKYTSLPKTIDPLQITIEQAIRLIEEKRENEAKKHIKTFNEEPTLQILNGRFGPYITYKATNYRLPKDIADKAKDLTLEECLKIVEQADNKTKTTHKRTNTKQK